MKKLFTALFVLAVCCAPLFAAGEDTSEETINQLEMSVYGSTHTGGLVSRLDAVENVLYGTKLQGTLAERQAAHMDFVERGSNDQPSLLFKMSVAEWGLEILNNGALPLVERVPVVEKRLEGEALTDRPIAMRVERVLGMVVADPVTAVPVTLPAGTVVRLQLMQTLKPATAKKGDAVLFRATHNVVVDGKLVIPAGAPAAATIASVRKPGMFGRPSRIKITVSTVRALGSEELPLTEGEESKKSTDIEASVAAAAGTSIVGAIALGPVGLAGGFLIRGSAKDVPAGSIMYMQTASAQTVSAYPVPESLKSFLAQKYYDVIAGRSVDLKTDTQTPAAGTSASAKSSAVAPAPAAPKKETELDSL